MVKREDLKNKTTQQPYFPLEQPHCIEGAEETVTEAVNL